MKHSIISRQNVDMQNSLVKVQLMPENQTEIDAIKNMEMVNASDIERELVENYLNFGLGLGNYSVVKLISQEGNYVTLKIFI